MILTAALGCFAAGCGPDSGDLEAAKKASAEIPKSVDELPADMPPEARAQAAAAMAQSQAMSQQQQAENDARKRAMQEMQKQKGN